jgi:hypothetical protein
MTSTYANGPATTETVQDGIRANVDPTGRLISMSVDPMGTHGVVLWKRDQPSEQQFVVHRWATTYTDGQPVPGGVMFYSGGYYGTLEEANEDLKARA